MLIENWSYILRTAWSVRIAVLTGILSGLIAVWSMFATVMPLWAYALLSVLMNVVLILARLTKQPGIDGNDG